MFFCVIFLVSGYMFSIVCYFFVVSVSTVDCLGRFISELTCSVLIGMLKLTNQLTVTLLKVVYINVIHLLSACTMFSNGAVCICSSR